MTLGDLDSRVVRRGLPALDEELAEVVLHMVTDNETSCKADKLRSGPSSTSKRAPTAASKILFLDGVRGLAAILVVTQHSHYMRNVNLGLCAVDIVFVLSPFLLTMIFYKKSTQLLHQRVTLRKWGVRARRLLLQAVPARMVYFLNGDSKPGDFDLFKALTFEFPQRYHVFWTLPLEITYYFLIPFFVLAVIRLKKVWWLPFVPLYYWIWSAGRTEYRDAHQPLQPHLPTFISGSMAAVIYLKIDEAIKRNTGLFMLKKWQVVTVRAIEWTTLALLLSVCFRGLLFHWLFTNPAPEDKGGARFVSLHVGLLIVIEMLLPSELSAVFEWSLLRYWGKISFSVYLLHSFVVYSPQIHGQKNYYGALFSQLFLTGLLATASYYAVEYPSLVLSTRISKALARLESDGAPPRTSSTFALYKPVATTDDHSSHASAA